MFVLVGDTPPGTDQYIVTEFVHLCLASTNSACAVVTGSPETLSAFHVTRSPAAVLVDQSGLVVWTCDLVTPDIRLTELVNEVLAEPDPS